MIEFWGRLAARDRHAIVAGAALSLLAVTYAYVWVPVSHEREALVKTLPTMRAQLQQMREQAAEVGRLQAAGKPAQTDVQSVLEQSARALNLRKSIAQIGAEGGGRVRVSLPAVKPGDWFAWVARLQGEHGIRVETVRMEAVEEPDRVKIVATFLGRG